MNMNTLTDKKFSNVIHSPEWPEADNYAPDMGSAFLSEGWWF